MSQQAKTPASLARGPQVAERNDAVPMAAVGISAADDLQVISEIR